jgi:hypothetical protein
LRRRRKKIGEEEGRKGGSKPNRGHRRGQYITAAQTYAALISASIYYYLFL